MRIQKRINSTIFLALFIFAFGSTTPAFGAGADSIYDNLNTAYLPSLEAFAGSLNNGQSNIVRGIYIKGVLALIVKQQPSGNPLYVFEANGYVTQFRDAANNGVIGLLAHSYLSGSQFAYLALGQIVNVIYGDGRVDTYLINTIRRFQYFESVNNAATLKDLDSGIVYTSVDVFYMFYTGGNKVTFQTCISRNGDLYWGRMFVEGVLLKKYAYQFPPLAISPIDLLARGNNHQHRIIPLAQGLFCNQNQMLLIRDEFVNKNIEKPDLHCQLSIPH